MAQDYAYQNDGPDDPKGRKIKQLGKLCLYFIVLTAVFLTVRYLYMNVDFTRLEEKAIATLPSTSRPTPVTSPTIAKPRFEFYTMLPKGETVKLQHVKKRPPIKQIKTALTPPSAPKPTQQAATPNPTTRTITQMLNQTTTKRIPLPTTVAKAPSNQPNPKIKTVKPPAHQIAKATMKKPLAKRVRPIAKSTVAQSTKGQFLLQVGSFKTFTEAHKLKGQLILEGFTVKISSFTNESITWHRVEVGPYHSLTQAQKAQDTLEEANLNCLLKRIG